MEVQSVTGAAAGPRPKPEENPAEAARGLRMPRHVAIIMDGNGRWAQRRGLPRGLGHRAGVESVRRVIRGSIRLGVRYLTLYAFSTENWRRPPEEVSFLWHLLGQAVAHDLEDLYREGVRFRAIGAVEELPEATQRQIRLAEERTAGNSRLYLQVALNYGGRREIVEAVRRLAAACRRGEIDPAEIDERRFARELYTAEIPDPDLLIRTAGEYRISNFLLWQVAYCELWVSDVLWPDFGEEDLRQAVEDYSHRQRRFGGLSEWPGDAP
ncbi:MAG: isoprenyl transferase [Bacillota bacterium]|nr:isoprenyl transferase [Bacillota bacterium]